MKRRWEYSCHRQPERASRTPTGQKSTQTGVVEGAEMAGEPQTLPQMSDADIILSSGVYS
jgi:hypothetical protein